MSLGIGKFLQRTAFPNSNANPFRGMRRTPGSRSVQDSLTMMWNVKLFAHFARSPVRRMRQIHIMGGECLRAGCIREWAVEFRVTRNVKRVVICVLYFAINAFVICPTTLLQNRRRRMRDSKCGEEKWNQSCDSSDSGDGPRTALLC